MELGGGYYIAGYIGGQGIKIGMILCGPEMPECKFKGRSDNGKCCGAVMFKQAKVGPKKKWKVLNEDPLTITPSIRCDCSGQHGHIIDGKWVKA